MKNINISSLADLLKKATPFKKLTKDELGLLAKAMQKIEINAGEELFSTDDLGKECYIVIDGELSLNKAGRIIKYFKKGDFFGEIAMIDEKKRLGTVTAVKDSQLYMFPRENLNILGESNPVAYAKIYKGFSELIISYLREEISLYEEMDVLLIQDGGCAPGYNPVTAYLTEFLEKAGRETYIANEGFRSLVSNRIEDYRYLVYSRKKYEQMERMAGVVFSTQLREARGADFRSERFPEFSEAENQRIAAQNLIKRKVKTIIAIGGNGTFMGIQILAELLPDIRFFFIPVTIDSDINGTETIGQHTGVEVGAEKIRSYLADARTHDRIYLIEMMGANGGYHALHACLGAGAHLAVIPGGKYDYQKLAEAINHRTSAVIVVAEGFAKEERKATGFPGNAAEYFRLLLVQNGMRTDRRIVAEPFSRDIRGAAPNNMDISLAQRMAHNLVELIKAGKDRTMPATLSGKDHAISFADIRTDNQVEKRLAQLANRLV